jgi:hypothetical protein
MASPFPRADTPLLLGWIASHNNGMRLPSIGEILAPARVRAAKLTPKFSGLPSSRRTRRRSLAPLGPAGDRVVPMLARRLPTRADLGISKSHSSQRARFLRRAANCCRAHRVTAEHSRG